MNPHIRWMIRRDMPEVYEIERQCFGDSWTTDEWLGHLRQRNCIGQVVEVDDKIVGYVLYELHKSTLNVINLAVDPAFRRRGVGALIVAKLIGKLCDQRRNKITVSVGERNDAAHLFFRSHGFIAIGVIRDHFADGQDAYCFEYRLKNLDTENVRIYNHEH